MMSRTINSPSNDRRQQTHQIARIIHVTAVPRHEVYIDLAQIWEILRPKPRKWVILWQPAVKRRATIHVVLQSHMQVELPYIFDLSNDVVQPIGFAVGKRSRQMEHKFFIRS